MLGPEANRFLYELARRIAAVTNEPPSPRFLLQGLAVAVQRGIAAAVMGSVGFGTLLRLVSFFPLCFLITRFALFFSVCVS